MGQWDITIPPARLSTIHTTQLTDGMILLLPLTHRGHGPGLILLVPDTDRSLEIVDGVPSPAIKWAEEGYCVIEIQKSAFTASQDFLNTATKALKNCLKCDSGGVGLVGRFSDGISSNMTV